MMKCCLHFCLTYLKKIRIFFFSTANIFHVKENFFHGQSQTVLSRDEDIRAVILWQVANGETIAKLHRNVRTGSLPARRATPFPRFCVVFTTRLYNMAVK